MDWNVNNELSQWAQKETVYNCEDVYCVKESGMYHFHVSKQPGKRVIQKRIATILHHLADFIYPEVIHRAEL